MRRFSFQVAACLSTETKLVMSNRDDTEQVLSGWLAAGLAATLQPSDERLAEEVRKAVLKAALLDRTAWQGWLGIARYRGICLGSVVFQDVPVVGSQVSHSAQLRQMSFIPGLATLCFNVACYWNRSVAKGGWRGWEHETSMPR